MDINLPDISGFEALTILLADPSTAKIPIIAVSAPARAAMTAWLPPLPPHFFSQRRPVTVSSGRGSAGA